MKPEYWAHYPTPNDLSPTILDRQGRKRIALNASVFWLKCPGNKGCKTTQFYPEAREWQKCDQACGEISSSWPNIMVAVVRMPTCGPLPSQAAIGWQNTCLEKPFTDIIMKYFGPPPGIRSRPAAISLERIVFYRHGKLLRPKINFRR